MVLELSRRRLGARGPWVGALGLGAMELSSTYGPADDAASKRLLDRALDLGVTLVDTADGYGNGHNERLIGAAIAHRRDDVVLATKFGARALGLGRPEPIRAALEASLGRLGVDHVDIYYLHRVDQTTPIEETIGVLGELVVEGKIGHIGLCEVGPDTVRLAHATFPITVVQQEYSLLSREPEQRLMPVLAELGIGLVAYSPLGRGLLTGRLRRPSDLPIDDPRRTRYPRFYPENLAANLALVDRLRELAEERGSSPEALALAWVAGTSPTVVPIVGTRTPAHLEANIAAASTELEHSLRERLAELFPPGIAAGDRYNAEMSRRLDQ